MIAYIFHAVNEPDFHASNISQHSGNFLRKIFSDFRCGIFLSQQIRRQNKIAEKMYRKKNLGKNKKRWGSGEKRKRPKAMLSVFGAGNRT
jgi:hypothetical protein